MHEINALMNNKKTLSNLNDVFQRQVNQKMIMTKIIKMKKNQQNPKTKWTKC